MDLGSTILRLMVRSDPYLKFKLILFIFYLYNEVHSAVLYLVII
jgi:hypothetical protein